MGFVIRTARGEDALAIAGVKNRSWQTAYAGIIDQGLLDALSDVDVADQWAPTLEDPPDSWAAFVAEDVGPPAEIGAFVVCQTSRDDDIRESAGPVGEIGVFYALPTWWGRGAGRALMDHAECWLRGAGFKSATLWVLERNAKGRHFYDAAGWRPDGTTKVDTIGPDTVIDLRYRKVLSSAVIADDKNPAVREG